MSVRADLRFSVQKAGIRSAQERSHDRSLSAWSEDEGESMTKPILDVGCGPDEWGDVRLDIDLRTQTGVKSQLNVMADAHYLPFIDKAFYYVRCWHVLEHIAFPALAVCETRELGIRQTFVSRSMMGSSENYFVICSPSPVIGNGEWRSKAYTLPLELESSALICGS